MRGTIVPGLAEERSDKGSDLCQEQNGVAPSLKTACFLDLVKPHRGPRSMSEPRSSLHKHENPEVNRKGET